MSKKRLLLGALDESQALSFTANADEIAARRVEDTVGAAMTIEQASFSLS